jgi:hypothetical protein
MRLHLRKAVKHTLVLAKQLSSIEFGIALRQRTVVPYWLGAFADIHTLVRSQTLQPSFTIRPLAPLDHY